MDRKQNSLDNVLDVRELLYKIRNNWYYFLLSILLSLFVAFAYTRYSHEFYKVSTRIMINGEDEGSDASEILYNNVSDKNNGSIVDRIQLLSSYQLVLQTVSDLRFDVSYYLVGNIKTSESLFAPIKISCDTSMTQNNPTTLFEIDVINKTSYQIFNEKLDYKEEHNFGDEIQIQEYNFVVERDSSYNFDVLPKTIVRFNSLKKVSKKYQSKIQIDKGEKESNVLVLSILEEDQRKGVSFLNTLVKNFIKKDIEIKKESSLLVVNYIHKEIQVIEDYLVSIDIERQDYEIDNQIPDFEKKIDVIYEKISQLEKELSIYKRQDNFYSYLEDNIKEIVSERKNNKDGLEKVVALATYDGITDPTFDQLIKDLGNIQKNKNGLINKGQINNPSIYDFDLQIVELIKQIQELIRNNKQINLLHIEELNNDINLELSSLDALPIEQRGLLDIERIQKISEQLYIFLKQKNYEAESRYEGIVSNIDHFDRARFFNMKPVLPEVTKVYSISLFVGVLLPFLILLILDLINNKIRSRVDLDKLTDIEMIGVIGRNHSARSLLTDLNPKSSIAEGFRALRSNLNYKDIEAKNKVYLLTSSVSGEGKTFIASNLAIVFANAGRKTLLLGADLRRPKLYKDFDSDNTIGLSTILNGKNSIEECTIKNITENLDVIVSGPLPSNPSDILLSEGFGNLIKDLKDKYDKIIIDTAPIGLVADAYMITKYSDVNLYVVRQDYTQKDVVRFVNDLYENKRIYNLYLVINDVSSGSGVYGYGKYGYGYGYGYATYVSNIDYFNEEENEVNEK